MGKKLKHRSSCSGLKPWCHICLFFLFLFIFPLIQRAILSLDSTFKLYLGSDTTSLFFFFCATPSRSHHHFLVWITAIVSLTGYSEVYFQHSNQCNLLKRMLCNFLVENCSALFQIPKLKAKFLEWTSFRPHEFSLFTSQISYFTICPLFFSQTGLLVLPLIFQDICVFKVLCTSCSFCQHTFLFLPHICLVTLRLTFRSNYHFLQKLSLV